MLIKGEFKTKTKGNGATEASVYGPGEVAVQPGGAVRAEVNAGKGELVPLLYFEGPVDFNLAE